MTVVIGKSYPTISNVTWTFTGVRFGKWVYEPGQVYVQICNGRDRYEFGFNGQMKTNEIAGEGNHNTALYGELDTRTARRWNLDPKRNVSVSPFAVFGNNPI